MRKTYLSFTLIGVLASQSGCGTDPDEKAGPAMSAVPESPKSSTPTSKANAGGQSAKNGAAESARITLAIAPPGDPNQVKIGAPLDLVCNVTADPAGWEPDGVILQISPERNNKLSLGKTIAKKPVRQDHTFSFTAQLNAPEKPGAYMVSARVVGVDPNIPAPPPAPAADGTQGKSGARVEFPAPSLKINVIKETPPA